VSERITPLAAILAQVPDPRKCRGRQYPCLALLLLVVVGLLCGANSQRALARWGHNSGRARLRRLGLLGSRSPSQPTLHRLLRDVDINQLEAVLGTWLQPVRLAWRRSTKRWVDGIALDGKTLRGARRLGAANTHLLAASGHLDGLVLAQVAVVDHAGELSGIRALLEALLLEGQTLTMDAAFTQWTVAEQIVQQGGAYLMVVKGNQAHMREHIAERTAYLGRCLGQAQTRRLAHGRLEQRTLPRSAAPSESVMSRIEARRERRLRRRASLGGSSWMAGLGLVIVGGLFLLQNAGLLVPGQQVWGLLCYLAAIGATVTAFSRYRAAGSQLSPVVTSAISGALLLAFVGTMLAFDLSWGVLRPMFLVIPGAMAIIGSATGLRHPADSQ
jgi:hypothetical protein